MLKVPVKVHSADAIQSVAQGSARQIEDRVELVEIKDIVLIEKIHGLRVPSNPVKMASEVT